jgi:hypothetical protein
MSGSGGGLRVVVVPIALRWNGFVRGTTALGRHAEYSPVVVVVKTDCALAMAGGVFYQALLVLE